tara:strand:+ start:414 stop:605 length:192 start_codon:yes stop_codon:yes gene_type:complete
MNIKSAKYYKDSRTDQNVSIVVTLKGDESGYLSVPLDPANTEYAEIMRQVEAGILTIAPADEE